jgi:hypothetical protein
MGSHASTVSLDKSRLLIAQAVPSVEGVTSPHQVWCVTDAGLVIDRPSLERAVSRAVLEPPAHSVRTSHAFFSTSAEQIHLFPFVLH